MIWLFLIVLCIAAAWIVAALDRRGFVQADRVRVAHVTAESAQRWSEIDMSDEQRATKNSQRRDYIRRTLFPDIS